jgi:hypothetical protein
MFVHIVKLFTKVDIKENAKRFLSETRGKMDRLWLHVLLLFMKYCTV